MPSSTRLSSSERREGILETAIRLFSERGFRGVTTRELATSVGVTEPVLYQHFPSKRDLYRAIIEHKMEQSRTLTSRLDRLFVEASTPEEFFRTMSEIMVEHHDSDPTFIRLMLWSGLEGNEFREVFRERMINGYFAKTTAVTQRFIDQGLLRDVPAEVLAYSFVSLVMHHCLDSKVLGHPLGTPPGATLPGKDLVAAMVEVFLAGAQNAQQEKASRI